MLSGVSTLQLPIEAQPRTHHAHHMQQSHNRRITLLRKRWKIILWSTSTTKLAWPQLPKPLSIACDELGFDPDQAWSDQFACHSWSTLAVIANFGVKMYIEHIKLAS
jgi:hypothetical protein